MRFWWQNLNEKPGDRKGPPIHGRCRLWLSTRHSVGLEWSLTGRFCHAELSVKEREVQVSLAIPPLALWLDFEGSRSLLSDWEPRNIGIRLHDGAVWWELWHTAFSWSSSTPRWRSGNLNFLDLFLGRSRYSERDISSHRLEVPMPEGTYPATVKMFESTWKRPRWFAKRLLRAKVDLDRPIPVPGKGENSWDCGDDATYGVTCVADDPERAVAVVVEDALRTRQRRGGFHRWRKE